jgi:uncharacterized protein (DUF2235 family)
MERSTLGAPSPLRRSQRPLARTTRIGTRMLGMVFGYGLEADIRHAYVFLMNNFEDEDRVFFFGFSRGACSEPLRHCCTCRV